MFADGGPNRWTWKLAPNVARESIYFPEYLFNDVDDPISDNSIPCNRHIIEDIKTSFTWGPVVKEATGIDQQRYSEDAFIGLLQTHVRNYLETRFGSIRNEAVPSDDHFENAAYKLGVKVADLDLICEACHSHKYDHQGHVPDESTCGPTCADCRVNACIIARHYPCLLYTSPSPRDS